MLKIVADNKIPFLKGELEHLAQVEYLPGGQIANHHLRDAQALMVRTRTRCDENLLKGTAVRFIATATIGYDHIDTDYCRARGIRWINAPGCNANSVKQYIGSAISYIINKQEKRFGDLTLGIIGAGRVGSRVQVMAGLLGMKCLVNDPPRAIAEGPEGFVSLDEILESSDIITMHVPLNNSGRDNTLHLADAAFFSKMKKGSWFINTSRGEVHHTPSLLEALKGNHLSGAIVDVWENEPAINRELLQAADIATPHIAGYSLDGKANGTTMSIHALSRFFKLGMDCWSPKNIPAPLEPYISLSCQNNTFEEIFYHLKQKTYNIQQDSDRLKHEPENFEKLREDYPLRREEKAYRVDLENCKPDVIRQLHKLGFRDK